MSEWDAFPAVGQQRPQQRRRVQRTPMPQIRFADDRDALTRTVAGEAGNQPDIGQVAVASVALNRARTRGKTPSEIVLERNQFEPWGNPETAARLMSMSPDSPEYKRAAAAVDRALAGEDPTGGASHFYAPRAQAALGRAKPSWDNGTGRAIGDHLFFSLEGGSPAPAQDAESWDAFPVAESVQQTANPESGAITVEEVKPEEVKTEGYNKALEQEKALQAMHERSGVGTGFTDQLTAPVNDELAALGGFVTQGLGNIGRRLTGRDIEVTAGERAAAARDVERAAQDAYVKENPGKSLLGGVLGGAAFGPGAGAAAVPGLLGRFGQAAAIGGAYGVAEGEGVGGRAVGGLLGAGLGAATQGLFEGLPVYARALSRDIERLRAPAGSTPNRGERRVASAIENAVTRDEMTPAGLLAGRSFEGQLPLERGGENLIGLAEVAAQSPGRARTAITNAVRTRAEGTSNRVSNRLGEGLGAEGNVYQNLQRQVTARGDAAKTGMAAIEATPVPLGEDSINALRTGLASKPLRDEIENAIAELSPEGAAAARRLVGLAETPRPATDAIKPTLEPGDRLRGSDSLNLPDAPTPDQMRQFGRVESVPLSSARRSQNQMDWERFGRRDSPGEVVKGYGDKPVAVRREDGEFIIMDGHHRTAQAIKNGQDSLEMHVIDARNYAPELAGRAPREADNSDVAMLRELLGEDFAPAPSAQLTVREAQDISYALNEAAGRAYRGGFGTRGERLKGLANAIRGDARQASPEYRQWLQQYGDDSQAIDALRTGTNVFAKANEKNAMSSAQLRERWSEWSDAAKDNYRLGVGEAILDKVRGGQDVATMRKLLKDGELAERARIAFGSDDAFERFMQSAADEVSMQNVNTQLLGGSPTMRRAAGAADVAEQDGGAASAALDFLTDMTSPIGATRQAVKMAIKSLPKKDRSIIGDQELNGLLGRALTDETEMTRLLNLLEAERSLLGRADSRVMGSGLLALPGVSATSQDRSRGLLTANP